MTDEQQLAQELAERQAEIDAARAGGTEPEGAAPEEEPEVEPAPEPQRDPLPIIDGSRISHPIGKRADRAARRAEHPELR